MPNASDIETFERVIPAPASAIFDLLADPHRHAKIDGSGTVHEAMQQTLARIEELVA